jgi:hypothetical protein
MIKIIVQKQSTINQIRGSMNNELTWDEVSAKFHREKSSQVAIEIEHMLALHLETMNQGFVKKRFQSNWPLLTKSANTVYPDSPQPDLYYRTRI